MKRHKKCRQKSAQEPPLWQTKTGRWPVKSPARKSIEITSDMSPEMAKRIRDLNERLKHPSGFYVDKVHRKTYRIK